MQNALFYVKAMFTVLHSLKNEYTHICNKSSAAFSMKTSFFYHVKLSRLFDEVTLLFLPYQGIRELDTCRFVILCMSFLTWS